MKKIGWHNNIEQVSRFNWTGLMGHKLKGALNSMFSQ